MRKTFVDVVNDVIADYEDCMTGEEIRMDADDGYIWGRHVTECVREGLLSMQSKFEDCMIANRGCADVPAELYMSISQALTEIVSNPDLEDLELIPMSFFDEMGVSFCGGVASSGDGGFEWTPGMINKCQTWDKELYKLAMKKLSSGLNDAELKRAEDLFSLIVGAEAVLDAKDYYYVPKADVISAYLYELAGAQHDIDVCRGKSNKTSYVIEQERAEKLHSSSDMFEF